MNDGDEVDLQPVSLHTSVFTKAVSVAYRIDSAIRRIKAFMSDSYGGTWEEMIFTLLSSKCLLVSITKVLRFRHLALHCTPQFIIADLVS